MNNQSKMEKLIIKAFLASLAFATIVNIVCEFH